ncbi:MAG: 50S ribosomal protein L31e [Nanoarchaeota archaeon]|nr:50S ribosomal protein L31e [Nanoarchaeota archaeon]
MAEKEKLEREYVIPLRNKWKRVPRYKRANKAVKAIKEFLAKHMKIRDRDLKKIKIDRYLNEEIWFRGIRKPPSKIKVKAVKEDDVVKAELYELPEKLKFKKAREEKREAKAIEEIKQKEVPPVPEEKTEESKEEEVKKEDSKKEEEKESDKEEKKVEAKEKKAAVVEAGQKMEKEFAKKAKHDVGGKTKQPKRQQRKALVK